MARHETEWHLSLAMGMPLMANCSFAVALSERLVRGVRRLSPPLAAKMRPSAVWGFEPHAASCPVSGRLLISGFVGIRIAGTVVAALHQEGCMWGGRIADCWWRFC